MKKKLTVAIFGVLLLQVAALPGFADQPKTASDAPSDAIVFIPPPSGEPTDRVGAGTRAFGHESGMLVMLVPEGGGVTALAKPPLIWYLDTPFRGKMESLIADLGPGQAGASKTVMGRFQRGYYALDLNRSDMSLAPGSTYAWTVTLIDDGSGEVLSRSTSYVERVVAAPEMTQVENTRSSVRQLAARGLWFDALEPLFSVDLSGSARLRHRDLFEELSRSAGLGAD